MIIVHKIILIDTIGIVSKSAKMKQLSHFQLFNIFTPVVNNYIIVFIRIEYLYSSGK